MNQYVQILTTVDEEGNARRIARGLLEERAAACVQILGPINSSYWWNDKIEQAQEWICLIKARAEDYERIQASIRRVHPYELPEILAIPVSHGNLDYLNWISRETLRKSSHQQG